MKGIIYKATDNWTGKVYIGQTVTSLKHRKTEHIKDSKREGEWNAFHIALYQHDFDFRWEVVDTFEGDADFVHHALNVAEEYHILKCRSAEEDYGYNSTYGGYSSDKYAKHYYQRMQGVSAPKAYWQYDLDGNFLRGWDSLNEIAVAFNRSKVMASELDGKWHGYQWRPKVGDNPPPVVGKYKSPLKTGVPVAVYDTSGNFVRFFERTSDAVREYGKSYMLRDDYDVEVTLPYKKRDEVLFYRVKDGRYPQKVNVTLLPPPQEKPKFEIVLHKYDAYDLDGNFLARFNSLKEAREAMKVGEGSIREGCRKEEPIKVTYCTKYLWRYGDGEIRPKINAVPYVYATRNIPKEHRVLQYSLDGEYIATHDNIYRASCLGGDSATVIRKICLGQGPVRSPQYQWRFYSENFPKTISTFDPSEYVGGGTYVRKKEHRVLQYSLQGEYIGMYDNTTKASDATGDSYGIIRNQCLGKSVKSSKFQWRYYTEDFSESIGSIEYIPKKGVIKKGGKRGRPRKIIAHPTGQLTMF